MMQLAVFCSLIALGMSQFHVPNLQPHCNKDADCAKDECCTSPLIGKRFLFDGIFGGKGHCKKLAAEGATCEPDVINIGIGGSVAHSLGCPCMAGLECHGERETHADGSHYYSNPKCLAAGSYTGPTVGTHAPATTAAPATTEAPVTTQAPTTPTPAPATTQAPTTPTPAPATTPAAATTEAPATTAAPTVNVTLA